MTFIDTSVVVRYLVGSPIDFFEKAKAIIETDTQLVLTSVALAEVAFVLRSVYQVPRETYLDALISFVQRQNISIYCINKELIIKALLLCRPSGRISLPDAFIWAAALSASTTEQVTVYTFDKRFPAEGIVLKTKI